MEVSYLKCNKELNINPHPKFSARTDILHTDGYSSHGRIFFTRTILKSVKQILIRICFNFINFINLHTNTVYSPILLTMI